SKTVALTSVTAAASRTASTARVQRTTRRDCVKASVSAAWLASPTGTRVMYASVCASTAISHAAQAVDGSAKPLGLVGSSGASIWNSAAEPSSATTGAATVMTANTPMEGSALRPHSKST